MRWKASWARAFDRLALACALLFVAFLVRTVVCSPMIWPRQRVAFDSGAWRRGLTWSCTPIRQQMAPDLVAGGRLLGATRAEVEALLGRPARKPRLRREQPRWEGALIYLLGPDRLGVDDEWLVVLLEDGARVREVLIVGD